MTRRRWVSFFSVAVIAACGSFSGSDREGTDQDASTPDATTGPNNGDGGAVSDAKADQGNTSMDSGPRCNPSAPWRVPVSVAMAVPVNRMGEFRLTPDEQNAYFDDAAGNAYFAPMVSHTAVGMPTPITIYGNDGGVASLTLSNDQSIAFFNQGSTLWAATRDGGVYARGTPALRINSSEPYLDEGANTLWIANFLTYAPDYQRSIMYTTVSGTSVGVFSTLGIDAASVYAPTPGAPNEGLYYNVDFGPPHHLDIYLHAGGTETRQDALNSDQDDSPAYVTRDGCYMYLVSTRSSPNNQLYVSVRGN